MPTPLTFDLPDYQTNETLKAFDSPDALGKAYLDLQTKVTAGDISVLGESAKDPIIARYKTIGELAKGHIEANKIISGIKKAPETAEAYKFTDLQNLHKGLGDVAATKKTLAAMFHKVGLDNDKADQLQQMILTGLSTGLVKNDETKTAKSKEVETKLRADWKENYDKNYNNVKNVLERVGLQELVADLQGNPTRLAGFHKITSLLSEDSIGRLGQTNSTVDTKTKEGAQNRIKEIMEKPELRKALADEKDPKHAEIKKEWMDSHAAAFAA